MMLVNDSANTGNEDDEDEDEDAELADWTVKYTVVAGCKTVKSIAKRVGLSPGALCAYNGGMGMLPSSTLRVGTELWVSAPALDKVRREVGGEKTSD